MTSTHRRSPVQRRGAAAIAMVLVMVLLSLVVVGMVLAGARDQDLTIARMETVRAFYAAEAGVNMSLREVIIGIDEDGDGGIGSISDDGDDGNDPALGSARLHVTAVLSGSTTTIDSRGRIGSSVRRVQVQTTPLGGGGGGRAMLAYGKSSQTRPYYRLWDGSAWSAEAAASVIGETPQWLVLRGSPTQDEFALATLDNDTNIEVQLWNGSAWSSAFQAAANAGDKTTRRFDLAYEQSSGELLLVYCRSGTSNVCYRTYDGSSWSAESTYAMTASVPRWLSLAPRPGTDEILLLASNSDGANSGFAAVWNGSSFTNRFRLVDDEGASAGDFLAGDWERLTGDGLALAPDDDASPRYRTLINGAWSNWTNAPSIGGAARWMKFAPHPSGNQILLGALDEFNDINMNSWSGVAWSGNTEVETNAPTSTTRHFDLCWEYGAAKALVAYGVQASNTLRYRTWNGSSWSAAAFGPSAGNSPIWTVQTVSGIEDGQAFVTWCTDEPALRTTVWNGTTFTGTTALGTASANKEYETFMVATSAQAFGNVRITSWIELPRN